MTGEIEAELRDLLERHGLSGKVGSVKYDSNGRYAYFSLEVSVVDEGGEAVTPERTAFLRHAPLHGIDTSWLGREFQINGQTVRLTGYNTKAKSYPFICTIVGDDRGGYKLSAEQLERYMNR
jgi:hypothetical protein